MYRDSRSCNEISAPSKRVVGIENFEVEMLIVGRVFQKVMLLRNPDYRHLVLGKHEERDRKLRKARKLGHKLDFLDDHHKLQIIK